MPNAAKYLDGQLVVGVNPDADRAPAACSAATAPRRPPACSTGSCAATVATGSRSGPWRSPSARTASVCSRSTSSSSATRPTSRRATVLAVGGREERQSSSGLICATGTGSTGWALSIARERGLDADLPAAEELRLAWFVREPWPSPTTGVSLDHGWLGVGDHLSLVSDMPENGVVFGDGLEQDRLEFLAGQTVRLGVAERALNLIVPAAA